MDGWMDVNLLIENNEWNTGNQTGDWFTIGTIPVVIAMKNKGSAFSKNGAITVMFFHSHTWIKRVSL